MNDNFEKNCVRDRRESDRFPLSLDDFSDDDYNRFIEKAESIFAPSSPDELKENILKLKNEIGNLHSDWLVNILKIIKFHSLFDD